MRDVPLRIQDNLNADGKTIASFGDEWSRFDQAGLSREEKEKIFSQYFRIFPWNLLPENAVGADIGCGSGRWADLVAPRVGVLHCVDASDQALQIATGHLKAHGNVVFHHASVDKLPFSESSLDFCYSLGVLHHVPDTERAICSCAEILKPGAPMLLYLYYAMENRPLWYRLVWKLTDGPRRVISKLPPVLKNVITDCIAAIIYFPLARLAKLAEAAGISVRHFPLSGYRSASFYTMRTDARDRFGTPLEKRYTLDEIKSFMTHAGLGDFMVSDEPPYWCVCGIKSSVK